MMKIILDYSKIQIIIKLQLEYVRNGHKPILERYYPIYKLGDVEL